MSEWKTYIVDDYTPFHGMNYLGTNTTFDSTLTNGQIALIVTNGTHVNIWCERLASRILIDQTKPLSFKNLKPRYVEILRFNSAKTIYKRDDDIDIPEPTVYKPRKITI